MDSHSVNYSPRENAGEDSETLPKGMTRADKDLAAHKRNMRRL